MGTQTIEIGDTNAHSGTKKAIIFISGPKDFEVTFGRMISGAFIPSYSRPSKSYKTAKGAQKAAILWVYH